MVVSWKMRMCHQDFLLGIYIVVVGFFTPSSLVLQQLASYGQCMIARLNSLQPWCRVRGHGQEERKKKIFWMFVGPSCRGQDYSRGQSGGCCIEQTHTEPFLAFWPTPLIPLPVKRQRRQQPLLTALPTLPPRQVLQPQRTLQLILRLLTKWRT